MPVGYKDDYVCGGGKYRRSFFFSIVFNRVLTLQIGVTPRESKQQRFKVTMSENVYLRLEKSTEKR